MTLLVYRLGGSLGRRLANQPSAHHRPALAEFTWRRVASVRGRRSGRNLIFEAAWTLQLAIFISDSESSGSAVSGHLLPLRSAMKQLECILSTLLILNLALNV